LQEKVRIGAPSGFVVAMHPLVRMQAPESGLPIAYVWIFPPPDRKGPSSGIGQLPNFCQPASGRHLVPAFDKIINREGGCIARCTITFLFLI
jgi:hypothetical protein